MKILMYILGLIFFITAIDAFEDNQSLWENILAFFIHSSLGIVLLCLLFFLRKHQIILGYTLLIYVLFLFLFFRVYQNPQDKWFIILVIIIPMFITGVLHVLLRNDNIHKEKV